MAKKNSNQIVKLIASIGFLLVGIYMLYVSFGIDCTVPAATTGGVTVQLPTAFDHILCTENNFQVMVLTLLGSVFLLGGGYAVVKNLT